jgi:hypothetical protein
VYHHLDSWDQITWYAGGPIHIHNQQFPYAWDRIFSGCTRACEARIYEVESVLNIIHRSIQNLNVQSTSGPLTLPPTMSSCNVDLFNVNKFCSSPLKEDQPLGDLEKTLREAVVAMIAPL